MDPKLSEMLERLMDSVSSLVEVASATDKKASMLVTVTSNLSEVASRHDHDIAELRAAISDLLQVAAAHNDRLERLERSQTVFDQRLAALIEVSAERERAMQASLDKLREADDRIDAQLAALIHIVDEWIRGNPRDGKATGG